MSVGQVFQSWYKGDDASKADIAQEAFKSVKKHFEQSNSLSSDEKALLGTKSSLQDVEKAVSDAFSKYEAKSEASKTRKWLLKASESICHYGRVLDVFVQHHPGYVSLAWGLMKLMFISVVNHGETLKLLSKSLFKVAQRLPRIEHLSALHPTKNMKLAIESLYSCIMEFLLIAHSWCNESKFKHIYHSFTRPHELRYGDLLQRIETCTDNINELATVGSQTELRVMHNTQSSKLNEIILSLQTSEKTRQAQIDGLNCAISRLETSSRDHDRKLDLIMQWLEASGLTINDLLTKIETFHSIHTSAQFDTNQKLSSLQLSQGLASFSQSLGDPKSLYKHHLFLRNRRASGRGVAVSTNEFWLSPKLAKWSSCPRSSLTIIRGSFTTRWAIQDFAIDIIQAVTLMSMPAIWVLGTANKTSPNAMLSPADLVRYLTYQALQIEGTVTTEKQMSLRHSQLEEAKTSQDWLELFKLIMQDSGGQIYIIIDLATIPLDPKALDVEAERVPFEDRKWSLGTDFIAAPSKDEVEIRWILGPAGRWAFRSFVGRPYTWIGFSSYMETSGHPEPTVGLFLEPWTGPVVDTYRILRWISSCEQLHLSICAMPTNLPFAEANTGLHVIRFIDTEDYCIVEMEALEKYIALSYNDIEDLELGVNVMDHIYERAWLTVVAACGQDANARLPGVRKGTRDGSFNTFEIVSGIEMGIVPALDGLLERSVYNSRAWTFQEQVLSRRGLYFIDNKVFYRCRAGEHAEHFVDDLSKTCMSPYLVSQLPLAVRMTEPVFDLWAMFFYYTKRVLTNQNDISRAMAGIIRRFAEFWTLSLFYRIFDIDVFRSNGYLQDSNDKKCGFVWLDGFEETEFFESGGSFEIILLSEAYGHLFVDQREVQWQNPYPLSSGQWNYYNIMILEWLGGIAERRGFGLLNQGAVEFSLAPGPSWKEIFLA
ncbi:hypothetical protein FAGAP_2030 [Fusarium agapanthi]|uniref:Heterokaryon incompatibility domain-containing protein n=1 Tax=Fusarium agapanthi TaxID=1803897 RepID=A0A9P5BIE7_9HYPO|nr:hypothetical protein FAGAP_2030 [Fusarium agapanthi]